MKKTLLELGRRLLPHFVLCLAVVFLVFLVLNRYNPTMAFLSNQYSSVLMLIFCILAILESILFVIRNRKGDDFLAPAVPATPDRQPSPDEKSSSGFSLDSPPSAASPRHPASDGNSDVNAASDPSGYVAVTDISESEAQPRN